MKDGVAGWGLAGDRPVAEHPAIAMTNVGEGRNPEEETASLRVYKLDGANIRKGGEVFHEEAVTSSLGVDPLILFKAEVVSNVIEKFPCVGKVAGVNIEALGIAGLTEDRPGDSGLQLEVVEGDRQQLADFIIFAEVGDDELGVLNALFRFKVKDFHAAKVRRAMSDGSRGGAVDTHLGEEGGEVGGLELLALLAGKACRADRVL